MSFRVCAVFKQLIVLRSLLYSGARLSSDVSELIVFSRVTLVESQAVLSQRKKLTL